MINRPLARAWAEGAAALGLLTASAVAHRAHLYASVPHPLGTDGYYYVVQLEDLAALGALHVPDSSWVFHALVPFSEGPWGPILGMKLGVALLLGLAVPAAALAGWRLGGALGAILLALWAALSPTLTHLGGDFPKNAGVVVPLLLLIGALAPGRAREGDAGGRGRIGWMALGAGALLLAAAAHRVGAVLGGLVTLGWALGAILGRMGSRAERWGPGGIALGILLGGAALAALGGEIDQLGRILPELRPGMHLPGVLPYLGMRGTGPLQLAELMLGVPILLWGIARGGSRGLGLILPLSLCVLPLWRTEGLDLGYRLSLMAPLFAMPLAAQLLGARGLPALAGRGLGPWGARALVVGLILALPGLSRGGFDAEAMPPYDAYRARIDALPRPLPALLIAHQGITFYYDHLTGEEAMAWAPEPDLDRAEVYRMVYGVKSGEWLHFLGAPEAGAPPIRALGGGYHYVREDTWEGLIAAARQEGDVDFLERILTWRNPHQVRPGWMMKDRRGE